MINLDDAELLRRHAAVLKASLAEARVKSYTRRSKTGKAVMVKDFERKDRTGRGALIAHMKRTQSREDPAIKRARMERENRISHNVDYGDSYAKNYKARLMANPNPYDRFYPGGRKQRVNLVMKAFKSKTRGSKALKNHQAKMRRMGYSNKVS